MSITHTYTAIHNVLGQYAKALNARNRGTHSRAGGRHGPLAVTDMRVLVAAFEHGEANIIATYTALYEATTLEKAQVRRATLRLAGAGLVDILPLEGEKRTRGIGARARLTPAGTTLARRIIVDCHERRAERRAAA